jgi:AraC-like DNA-binding protein
VRRPSAEEPRGLAKNVLGETGEFVLELVECTCSARGWSPPEPAERFAIVFVRRGCFTRRVNGAERFVDPTVAYFERPADEQQIAHHGGGDSCSALYLSEVVLASLWGGEPGVPDEPVPTDARTDLRHRLLLARVARGTAADAAEDVVALAAAVLARAAPKRVGAGRPATAVVRRRVVSDAREALADAPAASLVEVAARVAVSPHHLSRVFSAETGESFSRYRNRLRVGLALDRIAEGEPCLARLAADLGFSDQAHLARVVRSALDTTPSDLRKRLVAA